MIGTDRGMRALTFQPKGGQVPTKAEVLAVSRDGRDYEAAARALGIPAGQAYLIATGTPADSSGSPPLDRLGVPVASTQHLANPPHHNPTTNETVRSWLRSRAQGDAQMSAAGDARAGE